jgi:hypothetical protein
MKDKTENDYRLKERGSASIKLVVVLVILVLLAHAGFNFIPVAYSGENFKQEMHTAVVYGTALPGNVDPVTATKTRLQRAAVTENLPQSAFIEVKRVSNVLQAHVAYSQQVSILPFGIYVYDYQFNHIATPNGFLMRE